eukprot:585805_1
MSGDQFSLWLLNRDLFDHLTEETLQSRQNTIISSFGGFRAMFLLCMSHHHNLDLLQHRKLHKLLNSITSQQNHKSCLQPLNNTNITESLPAVTTTNVNPDPLSMHDVHDVCVSIVFTFLSKSDHISLQKTCKSMTIIGRKKDSFRIVDHSYISFGVHLTAEHKLSYIVDHLKSKHLDSTKGMRMLLSLFNDSSAVVLRGHVLQSVLHSGILPLLFRLSLYSKLACHVCTNLVDEMLLIAILEHMEPCSVSLMIKYGLLKFMKVWIHNRNVEIKSDMFNVILTIIESNSECVIPMNKTLNVFPFLINNMLQSESTRANDYVPQAFIKLISSQSFDWDSGSNHNAVRKMAKYLLLRWAEEIIRNKDEDDEQEKDEHVTRVYDTLEKKNITCLHYNTDGIYMSVSLNRFRQKAKESADTAAFLKTLSTDDKFMDFLRYELDNDPDFAAHFILNMLNNRDPDTDSDVFISKDARMVQKLIRACYPSTSTTAMECCLTLSHIAQSDSIMDALLWRHGLVYAFQDFISYFKDQTKHSGLLCQVMNALDDMVRQCSRHFRRHYMMGKSLKQHFLTHEGYSDELRETVEECVYVW